MDDNVTRIARRIVAGRALYRSFDEKKYSEYTSDVADRQGIYRNFTGSIDYGMNKATVTNASFQLCGTKENGDIIFERGVWNDGNWNDGRFENGTWENGVWNRGSWCAGTWKNGTWKSGEFGTDETKRSIWNNGVFEDGEFQTGDWRDGVWKKGKWSSWHQNFWHKGTDGDGTFHGKGQSPLKWT